MTDEPTPPPPTVPADAATPTALTTLDQGELQPLRRLPRRRRPWRWILLGAGVLGAAALGVALLRPRPVEVELAPVSTGSVQVTVTAEGRTRIAHRHVVVAPVTGVLARPVLRAGDSAQAGAPVATLTATADALLDPRSRELAAQRAGAAAAALVQARAAVTRATVAAAQAARDLARASALEAAGAIAPQQVEQLRSLRAQRSADAAAAQAGVRAAEHEVAAARATLASFRTTQPAGGVIVPSPMTGLVLRVLHEDEGIVAAGTPLLEIGDPATMEVLTDVLSEDAVQVRTGAGARVITAAGDTIGGTVARVEPQAFTRRSSLGVDEQRVHVVIRLAAPAARLVRLGDGFRVDVAVEQAVSARNVLVVPAGALVRQAGAWAVFRARDGVARRTPVTVGLRTASSAEIRAGLSAGDQVILFPSDAIVDGRRITPATP